VAGDATTIDVLLVDDEALVRSGLRWMIEAAGDMRVVGEADDGGAGVELALQLRPAVVLMDIRMEGLDGIKATRRLIDVAGRAAPRVIVLTTFDFERNVYDALKAGASGFLLKDTEPQRLIEGIRTVVAGETLLAPEVTRRIVEQYTAAPRKHSSLRSELTDLTDRELDVLTLLARGLSNAELASRAGVSQATIKTHL
jgi:DNA-binding NarL/FixJ family response regulator